MNDCPHKNMLLLPGPAKKVRCVQCHLVINEDDLDGGDCPECYEERGERWSDFEDVKETPGGVKYRCEDCGIIIAGN